MYLNKKILTDIFNRKPEGRERFVFIVHDSQLAEMIVQEKMWAIDISSEEEKTEFFDFIANHFFIYLSEYAIAPSVGYGIVKEVASFLKSHGMKVLSDSWKVFSGKTDQFILSPNMMRNELFRYIDNLGSGIRMEIDIDIDRFHTFDSKGVPNGVKDYEVVEYLMKKEHFFVMGGMLYLYEKGYYKQDGSQTKTKEKIQNLLHKVLFFKQVTISDAEEPDEDE